MRSGAFAGALVLLSGASAPAQPTSAFPAAKHGGNYMHNFYYSQFEEARAIYRKLAAEADGATSN